MEVESAVGNSRIFVTGATGFIGQCLIKRLRDNGKGVTIAIRQQSASLVPPVFQFAELSATQSWGAGIAGHDVIIHCAGRVHILNDPSDNPAAEFHRVNVEGTLNLARQAAAEGVRRFIFLSSVKVNGEQTFSGRPFTAFDNSAPEDAYGISKLKAEEGLKKIAEESGMELVIIRPVMVYGAEVKANFRSIMMLLNKGLPLPLGAIRNKRSFVYLENLVDLLEICIDHPAAAGEIFLVSDGEDLSTPEVVRRMGLAMGKPARMMSMPSAWLETIASWVGKTAVTQRLCGSLQVDISHTRDTLGWTPPVSVDDGFRVAACAFLNE